MAFNLVASGIVCPVGFSAASSCAAIAAGVDGFRETRFMFDGDWLQAGTVPLLDHSRGRTKLLKMAAMAVDECLESLPNNAANDTLLIVCLAESERPGRLDGLDGTFVRDLQAALRMRERLGFETQLCTGGVLGTVRGLHWADQWLSKRRAGHCVVVGVDSYLVAKTLAAYHSQRRIITGENSDGFFPGEAAGAVLLAPAHNVSGAFQCLGMGWGEEFALLDSDKPLRGDGLTAAYQSALSSAGCGFEHLDYRLTSIAGDQYAFKETALALARTMRVRKEKFDLWHPADCIGEVGAAIAPIVLGVAADAARHQYAPGPGVLCHFAGHSELRAALVLREYGQVSQPCLP